MFSVLSNTTLKSTHGMRRIVSASTVAKGLNALGGIKAGKVGGASRAGRLGKSSIARSSFFILISNFHFSKYWMFNRYHFLFF